ncbi:hypothetical protein OSB04_015094 [Centaurea solstitialis]|uniref:Reverse transcriptase domain-containing protein n=1 Tax=Centaurea solstitialis TaxID=347529 RepID=A0AA38SZY2_9ASTR|nr:hypothetical protein OSB04_015094 [Centaurea solstitialis]
MDVEHANSATQQICFSEVRKASMTSFVKFFHSTSSPIQRKNIHNSTYLCYVKNVTQRRLGNVRNICKVAGLSDCAIKYLGGLSVLFEWSSKEAAEKALQANKNYLSNWFLEVKMWSPDDRPTGRLVWLNLEGLPTLAWNSENAKVIGLMFGKALEWDEADDSSMMLDSTQVLVYSMQMEEINNVINVSVNDRLFKVRVTEEHNHSFLINFPHYSSDSNSDSNSEIWSKFSDDDGGDAPEDEPDVNSDDQKVKSQQELRGDTDAVVEETCEKSDSRVADSIPQNNPIFGIKVGEKEVRGNSLDSNLGPGSLNLQKSPILDKMVDKSAKEPNRKKSLSKKLGFYSPQGFSRKHGNKHNHSSGSFEDRTQLEEILGVKIAGKDVKVGAHGGGIYRFFGRDAAYLECDDGNFFHGVIGEWEGINIPVGIINVYAPQASSQKEILWNELGSTVENDSILWILLGDFNSVRTKEEKAGSYFNEKDARLFNGFIFSTGLQEFSMGIRKFTRFSKDGVKCSKLDRFLVSEKFFNFWSDCSVVVLERTISDHAPILLKENSRSYGHPTFRFFNHWLKNPSFDTWVRNVFASTVAQGTADLLLKNKLKLLKAEIKKWSRDNWSKNEEKRKDLQSKLLQWDVNTESRCPLLCQVQEREKWLAELSLLEQEERNSFKQKARIKWACEGDENVKFFHSFVNKNRRKQGLRGINLEGVWMEDPEAIKEAVVVHFENHFKEPIKIRPKFRSPHFRKLEARNAVELEKPFVMEELKLAVWSCGEDKSPGPDGFSFEFIKKYWDFLKDDFFNSVKKFEQVGRLSKGCNPSFLVLVPKKKDPLVINDYRPISLIGCFYKALSKMLSLRLAKVLNKLIGPNQTAFLAGRQITDGVLIANELINLAKKEKAPLLAFKVDFEKAFDSINWDFLLDVLAQMGFGKIWCNWMKGCLMSASVSVLVNGTATREFKMERGLRQGDPLSPMLFILAAEALQAMIIQACNSGFFQGIRLASEGINLSLLQYADDALFFGYWSKTNLSNLIKLLKWFQQISGLKVNLHKSCVFGIGVDEKEVESVANSVNCSSGKLPFTYLGLPVGPSLGNSQIWEGVLNKISNKLAAWKSNQLSIGGRTTLIKAVLGNMPVYFLSLFKAPVGVINKLEAIRRKFFWGASEEKAKLAWINWSKVLTNKSQGGLGVSSILIKNISLLCKWYWRFFNEDDALWNKVIKAIYGPDGGFFSDINPPKGCSNVWAGIIKSAKIPNTWGVNFKDSIFRKIANGKHSKFWEDCWLAAGVKLRSLFPRLFALDVNGSCSVADRFVVDNGVWKWNGSWRSPPRGRACRELEDLSRLVEKVQLTPDASDRWIWSLHESGFFSSKALSLLLESKKFGNILVNGSKFCWNNLVPIKVNITVWRMFLDCLPTKGNILHRGIPIESIMCDICGKKAENQQHCLVDCHYIFPVWRKILSWWSIPFRNLQVNEVIQGFKGELGDKMIAGIFSAVCFSALWTIWAWRNRITHAIEDDRVKIREEDIFPRIQRVALLWISNRWKKNIQASWDRWISQPRQLFEV